MRRRNKNLTWIIIIVLILLGVVYAFNNDNNIFSAKESCPESIIPKLIILNDRLLFFQNYTWRGKEDIEAYNLPTGTWADGVEMDLMGKGTYFSTFVSICHYGSEKGENVNLVYCNRVSYSKTTTELSDEGVVGETKTISYSIDLVLEKINTRVLQSSVYGDFPVHTFKVVSSKCKKV